LPILIEEKSIGDLIEDLEFIKNVDGKLYGSFLNFFDMYNNMIKVLSGRDADGVKRIKDTIINIIGRDIEPKKLNLLQLNSKIYEIACPNGKKLIWQMEKMRRYINNGKFYNIRVYKIKKCAGCSNNVSRDSCTFFHEDEEPHTSYDNLKAFEDWGFDPKLLYQTSF
jgi:hypothetical protein